MWQKIAKISEKFTIISLITKLALVGVFALFINTANAQDLEISNIEISADENKVMISWNTNLASNGQVDYGTTDEYGRTVREQILATRNHEINLFGLETDTDYHFKITAYTHDQEVSTFDQVFDTDNFDDHIIPEIDYVRIAYIAGTRATIQWETSEPVSFTLYYGKTTNYGSKKSSSSRKSAWELTLTNLKPATRYHFKLKVKDKDGNVATYHDLDFRTQVTQNADTEKLTAFNIKPVSSNDFGIRNNSATITWHTNKIATSVVRYGTKSTKLNKVTYVKDALRTFDHEIQINKLQPDTHYYFLVESKDVFGKTVRSEIKSFITKPLPVVLGAREVQMSVNKANKTPASQLYKVGNKIYALLNNTKHYISNLEVFTRNGYNWAEVKDTSQDFINSLTDTKLVKSPDNPTVYYLDKISENNFAKIAIPNAEAFASYPQNSWSKVATIDNLDIDNYPNVNLIKLKNDTIVYLLEHNQRKPFVSGEVFERLGYNWADILEVSQIHLQNYPLGALVN